MADAYSTIVQQSLEKKNQEIQHNVNAASNAASMASSIVSSLSSLIETGVKLGKSVHDQDVSDETTRALNAYKEQEAYGKFDLIDMDDENSGYESDPEKTYANRLSWLDKELSTAYSYDEETKTATGYWYGDEVKKTMLQYLAGQKASIIEDKNATNYNKIQSAISGSIDYMNSPYYDPDATSNSIDFTISKAFKDDNTHINVESLLDVEDYGIKELAQNYIDTSGSVEADYALRYALGAYSAGESKTSYNSRKEANFESDFLNYKIGRWARTYVDNRIDDYIASGCDSSYINDLIAGLDSEIINNGLDWGTDKKLYAYELGTSGVSTATSQVKTYLQSRAIQVSKEQADAWNTAIDSYLKEYGSYDSYFDFTSVEDYAKYLCKKSPALNETYALKHIGDDTKTQIITNARNVEVGNIIGKIISPDTTEDDRDAAIRKAIDQGLTDFLSSDSGLGLGNLSDISDDNIKADVRLALDKLKVNGITYGKAFADLMRGSDIDTYKKTFASAPVDSVRAASSAEAYNYSMGSEDFAEKAIKLLSGDTSVSLDDFDKDTFRDLYEVKDEIEKNELVKQFLAKEDTTEDERKAVWNAYYYKTYSDSQSSITAANSLIASIESEMQNENDINNLISTIKPLVLYGKEEDETAWNYIVDNNLIDFVTGDNGLGIGDFKNGGKVNDEATFREYLLDYAEKRGITLEEAYDEAMKTALEGYSLSDLQATSESIKGGYMKVNTPVYNYQMLRSYDKTNAQEGFEDALVSAIATGDESSLDSLFKKYGTSWDDYTAYGEIYRTVKNDGLLQESFKAIDNSTKLSKEQKKEQKTTLAKAILNAEVSLITGTETEKKEAQTYINNLKGNAYLDNDRELISVGWILSNPYSESNEDGYSETFTDYYVESTLSKLIGKDAAETKSNVDDLLSVLKDAGYDLSEFEKKWGDISYEDGYLDSMTTSQFLEIFDDLQQPFRETAVAHYGAFIANYSDTTSNEYGYIGKKNTDVLKDKYDKVSSDLNDQLLQGLVDNGTIDFGVDYQGMKWSEDAKKAGGVGSQNYNDTVGMLILAETDDARQKILKSSHKYLTPEALATLEGVNSVNVMIHTLDGYEDYDFFNTVVGILEGNPTFYELAKKTSLSDWNNFLGESQYLKNSIIEKVRNFTDGTSFEAQLKDLAGEIAQAYVLSVDSVSLETKNSGFISSTFNPFNLDDYIDAGDVGAAESFFGSWTDNRNKIKASADTGDYKTQSYVYDFWNTGKSKTELASSITAKLSDPNINEDNVMAYTAVLAYTSMGYPLNGITSEAFDAEDSKDAYARLFNNMETMRKDDPERYSLLISITTELDKSFDDIRSYNALGYDYDYTYNGNGLQVSGYSKVDNVDGNWIAYDANGEQTNLMAYSNYTPLSDRATFILGDYSTGETNLWGNKIYAEEQAITTIEGLKQISSYNEKKSKTNAVSDYSTASEIVGSLSISAYNNSGSQRSEFEEITGKKLADRYVECLVDNANSDAAVLKSQLSTGMQKYITDSADYYLASIAIAHMNDSGDQDKISDASYLYTTIVSNGRGYTPSAKISKKLPTYDENPDLYNDALKRVLQKNGKQISRSSKKTLFTGLSSGKTLHVKE